MRVTPHFSAVEFDSHDGAPFPSRWLDERLRPLCETLEVIRGAIGNEPLTIISGYRSPAHNGRLVTAGRGAARRSQHVEGRAADFVVRGFSPAHVHAAVLALYREGRLPHLGGLGIYPSWVHVDLRRLPAGADLVRWTGEGFGSEPAA